ncbi:phage baseplate assembly protein [Pseudoroseomonas sp. WGS1072]|uniref:phage baseplate assembly protein n=1 Tax=Roseomonas sp. WGS1072 TaxID=3366816 RepID=UPI003BF187FF
MLLVDGQRLSGWQEIRVSRGIERILSDFDISLTERYPDEMDAAILRAGTLCQVLIGGDVVVTGYIDRYQRPTLRTLFAQASADMAEATGNFVLLRTSPLRIFARGLRGKLRCR